MSTHKYDLSWIQIHDNLLKQSYINNEQKCVPKRGCFWAEIYTISLSICGNLQESKQIQGLHDIIMMISESNSNINFFYLTRVV